MERDGISLKLPAHTAGLAGHVPVNFPNTMAESEMALPFFLK